MSLNCAGQEIRSFVDAVTIKCMTEPIDWRGVGGGYIAGPAPTTFEEFREAAARGIAQLLDGYYASNQHKVAGYVRRSATGIENPYDEFGLDDELCSRTLDFAPVSSMHADHIGEFEAMADGMILAVYTRLVNVGPK
jgi:hypothetical protein